MLNFEKVTDIFCLVAESCNKFDDYTTHFIIGNPSTKPQIMSKSEVILIIILFHLNDFPFFKHLYTYYI